MICHSEKIGERAGERGCRPERAPLESRRLQKPCSRAGVSSVHFQTILMAEFPLSLSTTKLRGSPGGVLWEVVLLDVSPVLSPFHLRPQAQL